MSTIFPKMSFEICILSHHAMMNCCDPSYISKSSSFGDQALVDSAEKHSRTCQSRLRTSYRMLDMLACS